jgi:hypothetical protein
LEKEKLNEKGAEVERMKTENKRLVVENDAKKNVKLLIKLLQS